MRVASRLLRIATGPIRKRSGSWPSTTFETASRLSHSARSWCTVSIPSARASGGVSPSSRWPSSHISPPSGWWIPLSVLISVLLPAPLSPTSATISPACTVSETPDSDCTPPNHFTMSRHCSTTRLAPFVVLPVLIGSAVTPSHSTRYRRRRRAAPPPAASGGHWPGGTLPVAVGVLRYLKYLLNTYAYFGLSGSKAIL